MRSISALSGALALLGIAPVCGCGVSGGVSIPDASYQTGQAANVVIGQTSFDGVFANQNGTTAAGATTLKFPFGVKAYQSSLFVADSGNNRVLVFNSVPTQNGASADVVLGKSGFTDGSNESTPSAANLSQPYFVSVIGGNLAVTQDLFNRISFFSGIPSANAQASFALGQSSLASNSTSCSQNQFNDPYQAAPAGNGLVVADSANRRVLIYKSVPASGTANADLVLGQGDFVTCPATSAAAPTSMTASSFYAPTAVWSDGTRLVITDRKANRVLIWNTFPAANNQAADVVLGQQTMTTLTASASAQGLNTPWGVTSDGTRLFVADSGNHRVLIWNHFPASNGAAADLVLGQSGFDTAAKGGGATGLNGPSDVSLAGTTLFVADTGNNRVLGYYAIPPVGARP